MTTRLTLSSRMWASHFEQSMPFQLSIVCDAVSVIRVDLQYGQRKLTLRSRSIRRSREILSTTRCTRRLPISWRNVRAGPILTNRPNCGKRQLFPRAQASRRLRPATGLEMQGAVGAGSGLVEASELREDEALVHPCDLVARVDVQRHVNGPQRFLVPAEEDEGRALSVPGDFRARDAHPGRGDGAVVLLEGPFVVPARHVSLREDQFPPQDRRRMPPPDLGDCEGR